MIRHGFGGMVLLAAVVFLLDAANGQPPGIADKYAIRDNKTGTIKTYEGTSKPGPAGYQLMSAEGKLLTTFYPGDIVRYTPGDLVGVDRPDVLAQLSLEDKKTRKDNEAAKVGYVGMIQKAANAAPKSKQYLAFKKALLTTRILDEAEDEEWGKMIEPAVKEWDDFVNNYKTGWELWVAARANARLYTELGKYRDSERLWKRMAGKDYELPADLKMDAMLLMIDAQMRGGGYATAATTAEAELKTDKPAMVKEKLAIYARAGVVGENAPADTINAAVKDIEKLIAASKDKDKSVQAVGFSMIGELYLASKRPRDAMWAFLWVETVYNSDKDEVFKAIVRLKQCFKELMDEDREKAYQEKIRRFRQQF